jgi:N-acetylglucosamine-6-sulfatase
MKREIRMMGAKGFYFGTSCRKAFGIILLALAAWVMAFSFSTPAMGREGRPNIIFILSDDHRWDAMGNMGHPFIKTPSLDRLAKEGVHFSNAFVTTPLCSPSRASFLTGQYPHRHGVKNNLTPWDDRNVTFLELLKKAGYKTAFIGKWHMPGRLPDILGKAVDRFVTFTVSGGQGIYFDCPLNIDGKVQERKSRYLTEDLTDLAIEFMNREKDSPFCIYLAHKAVHQPFWPSPEFRKLYEDIDVSRHLPPEYHSWVSMMKGSWYYGLLGNVEQFYRDYCRTITAMDKQIGRILAELDRLGIAEQTLVVYAGDNGIFWGEKQFIDKRWPYEEATRIPFIVRYPAGSKAPGGGSDQMVLNVDLAPTLLDAARLPVPESMQGKSLKPVLENRDVALRESIHLEYYKDFPYRVPEYDAVRTGRFLYVEYRGGKKPELFDIQKDPRTLQNIIDSPEGKEALPELKEKLREYVRWKTRE